ncbi:peroxisome biogenesis protein 22 [Tanacetum coccineum]
MSSPPPSPAASATLAASLSWIMNRKDIRSVWAVAGLAVAVIFTWRLLRTPAVPRRRQPKRQAPGASSSGANSHPDASLFPSSVSSSSEDSRAQTVIDEFFQPVKPTLGQIVRQRLSDGRKNKATVRSSVLDVLLEITKFCDLYLMETILDDESEIKVLAALENAGIFTSGGLVKDKVLFCSTEVGRTSFVRQLEPDWHIDSSREISTQLARFIKYQLHISTIKPERIAANVFSSSSLEQFFSV